MTLKLVFCAVFFASLLSVSAVASTARWVVGNPHEGQGLTLLIPRGALIQIGIEKTTTTFFPLSIGTSLISTALYAANGSRVPARQYWDKEMQCGQQADLFDGAVNVTNLYTPAPAGSWTRIRVKLSNASWSAPPSSAYFGGCYGATGSIVVNISTGSPIPQEEVCYVFVSQRAADASLSGIQALAAIPNSANSSLFEEPSKAIFVFNATAKGFVTNAILPFIPSAASGRADPSRMVPTIVDFNRSLLHRFFSPAFFSARVVSDSRTFSQRNWRYASSAIPYVVQAACAQDATCTGLYTANDGVDPEKVLFVTTITNEAVTSFVFPSAGVIVAYTKPSALNSTATFARTGQAQVWISQAFAAYLNITVQAVTSSGSIVLASCGGTAPFSNGLFGQLSACSTYYLCFSGVVSANDTLSVSVTSGVVAQADCNESLGIIYTLIPSKVTPSPLPSYTAPLSLTAFRNSLAIARSIAVPTSSRVLVLRVFVEDALGAILDVVQTGFAHCQNCGPSMISFNASGSGTVTCGPTFYGGVPGLSQQCSISGFSLSCGAISFTQPYTGFISIWLEVTSLRENSSPSCQKFFALLRLKQMSTIGAISRLRLADARNQFSPAILNVSAKSEAPVIITNYFGQDLFLSLPQWPVSPSATDTLLSSLQPQVCLMDLVDADSFCLHLIPRQATYVKVLVQQSSFGTASSSIRLVFSRNGSKEVLTVLCGGKEEGFSGNTGLTNEPDIFLTCTSQFLYANNSEWQLQPYDSIQLIVPANVATGCTLCNFSFVAVVNFSAPPIPQAPDSSFAASFHCLADGTWIPLSQICNGIVDCPADSVDERFCFAFKRFAVDEFFPMTISTSLQASSPSVHKCLQQAIASGISTDPTVGAAFAFNSLTLICTTYTSAAVDNFLHNVSAVLVQQQGSVLYVLPSSTGTFAPCSSVHTCTGNGVAVEAQDQGCRCVCNLKFAGNDCSTQLSLGSIQSLVFIFNRGSTIQRSVVQSALLGVALSSDVLCEYPEMAKSGDIAIKCSLTPQDSAEQVLKLTGFSAVNSALAAAHHPVAVTVTAQTVENQVSFDCVVSATFDSALCENSARFTTLGGLSALRISFGTNVAVPSAISLAVRDFASSTSLSVQCQSLVTTLPNGCSIVTCAGELSLPMNISNVSFALGASTFVESQLCYVSPTLAAMSVAALPIVESANLAAIYDDSLNVTLTYVTLSILALSLVCFVLATVFMIVEIRALKRLDHEHEGSSTVRDYLLQLFYRNVRFEDAARRWRSEDAAPAFAIIFINLLVAGVITGLCALTFVPSTHHAALLQVFRDDFCSNSSFAPSPAMSATINSTWDVECAQLNVAGSFGSKIFGSVKCIDATSATLVLATTMSQCANTIPLPITLGQCSPLNQFFRGDLRSFQIRCGLAGDIASAWFGLAALDRSVVGLSTFAAIVEPSPVPAPTVQSNVHVTPFLKGGYVFSSSSSYASRFESFYRPATYASPIMDASNGLWLVLQTNDTYASPSSRISTVGSLTSLLEHEYATVVSQLSASQLAVLSQFLIPSQDYPVATVFNGFSVDSTMSVASSLLQDKLAGPGSHRYFAIAGSNADIGGILGPQSFFITDQGLTVSFKLRATNDSRGFVFAVTDAYENVEDNTSPLLDSLIDIIQRGSSGSAWSPSYYVYSSIYLDGGAGMMSYVAAEPPQSSQGPYDYTASTLTNLQWDLSALGLDFLLNGFWHDVHVILRNENSRVKAQLVVDGVTSRTSPGWSICLDRRPRAVQPLASQQQVPVRSSSERVFSGGELLVGYLNGGVGDLTFTGRSLTMSDILSASSMVVRTANSPNLVLSLVLALLLFSCAAICGLLTLLTSGRELYLASRQRRLRGVTSAAISYNNIMSTPVMDDNANQFRPLKYVTARRWLGISDTQFAALINEIRENTPNAGREIYRTLFAAKEGTKLGLNDLAHVGLPSVAAWNACVTADEDELETSYCFFKRKRLEADPILSNGETKDSVEQSKKPGAVELDVNQLKAGLSAQKSSSTASSGASLNGTLSTELYQMALPIITTLQTVYVYLTTVQVPQEYRSRLSAFLSFVAIDFTVTFPRVPEIVTPFLQIIIGLLAISLFFYFCIADQRAFFIHLARYTLKRDVLKDWSHKDLYRTTQAAQGDVLTLQEIADNVKYQDELNSVAKSLAIPYSHDLQCEYECHARVLSVRESKRLDQFSESAKRGDTIDICDDFGHSYKLKKDVMIEDSVEGTCREAICVAASTSACTQSLEEVGVRCRVHHCRLTPREHSDVFPFAYQPSCCLYVNGTRCNERHGTMFSCPFLSRVEEGDRYRPCEYAVCEKHFRGTFWDELAADVCGVLRSIAERNWTWTFSVIILFVGNAAYTPLVQTALMIVSCNPYYQCQFPLCYATRSTLFYVSVTLAAVLLLCLGIGFPFLQFRMLRGRKAGLAKCFFSQEYNGRYTEDGSLSHAEWSRFISSDPTALASVYQALKFNWLFLPPFLLVAKSVLIVPAIVLEPDSSGQKIGIALVQIAYCMCVFGTSPFLSPIANAMYRIGSIHQLLLLGCQNMSVYSSQQSSWTSLMLFVTLCYLVICAACLVWIVVVPLVRIRLDLAATTAKLKLFGLQYSRTTSLYIVPSIELGFSCTARNGVEDGDNMANPSGQMLLKMFGLMFDGPLEEKLEDAPVMSFDFDVSDVHLGGMAGTARAADHKAL